MQITVDVLCIILACSTQHTQVLAFAKQAAASPDVQHRCAAMTVLAVICEGCADPLRKRLEEELLPLVLTGLQVRGFSRICYAFCS